MMFNKVDIKEFLCKKNEQIFSADFFRKQYLVTRKSIYHLLVLGCLSCTRIIPWVEVVCPAPNSYSMRKSCFFFYRGFLSLDNDVFFALTSFTYPDSGNSGSCPSPGKVANKALRFNPQLGGGEMDLYLSLKNGICAKVNAKDLNGVKSRLVDFSCRATNPNPYIINQKNSPRWHDKYIKM